MAHIDACHIVQLSHNDMEQACSLSMEAGWNQTERDWDLFFSHGVVFGTFALPGQLAASAAIMPYGDDIAWISMVLTKAKWRGRGFGTALLKHCLQWSEQQKRVAYLDATPAGEAIYRSLGFLPSLRITRWQGTGSGTNDEVSSNHHAADAIKMANMAFGADRSFLLESFLKRVPATLTHTGASVACFARDGRIAWQIGPVVSMSEREGTDCIEAMTGQLSGSVFIDLPDDCIHAAQRLTELGFTRQRSFLRMYKGKDHVQKPPYRTIAIAGPEFG